MPEQSKLHSFGLTDAGAVRGNNEDEIHFDDDRGIYFVIDGMGGHAAGEKAAQIAKEHLRGRLERPTGTAEQRVREAITLANEAIVEAAEQHPEWRGMACVLTVALVENGDVTVGHVGDSRLYRLAAGKLEKITRDHSPVGEMEDRGDLAEAEAMKHPRRNEVYRDVGSEHRDTDQPGFIDVYKTRLEPGEALLLCSDGLTDALATAEILSIIQKGAGDRAAIVRRLIARASEDGKDNISAVLVERTGRPAAAAAPPHQKSSWPKIAAGLIFGFLLGAAAMFLVDHRPPPPAPAAPPGPRHLLVNAAQAGGYNTIGAALQEARPGDTVELSKADYREAIVLRSGITLRGGGAVLKPPPGSDPLTAVTVTGAGTAVIENLKVRADGDAHWADGIHAESGELILRDVEVSGASGPGIEASGEAALTIEKSSIHDNAGPGILIRDTAAAVITSDHITRNGVGADHPQPGIEITSLTPCRIAENEFAGNGAPEAIWQPEAPTKELLDQNTFTLQNRKGRKKDVRVTGTP